MSNPSTTATQSSPCNRWEYPSRLSLPRWQSPRKLTGDMASVAAAVRVYKAKHKAITPKSVAEVVAEMLALNKARGASARYLEDLTFRPENFAGGVSLQC